jgi:folate-binding protein YgfZ
MSHCDAAILPDRGAVRIGGADARKFLQGLITNDMEKARDGAAIHAGLLSPQGKILFEFFVVPAGDSFLLEGPRSMAADLSKRLGFYKLRADITVADEPAIQVAAAWGEDIFAAVEGAIVYPDPRLGELGYRALLPAGVGIGVALGCTETSAEAYHAMRIGLGVPEGGRDFAYGDAFPHEALFDQLNGVDFAKGCYVGQEVVSRMEHRGTARKRIVPVSGDDPLPPAGSEIMAGSVPIGTLGSVNGRDGLALLRLDRAGEALTAGKPLTAGGVPIRLRRPAFARFDMPVEAAVS